MSIASQEQPVGKRGNSAGNGKFEPNRKEFEQARTKGLKAQRPQKKVLRGAYFSGYRFQGSLDDRDLEDFQQGSGISRARRTKVEEREMIGGRRAKLATGVSSISYRAEARRKEQCHERLPPIAAHSGSVALSHRTRIGSSASVATRSRCSISRGRVEGNTRGETRFAVTLPDSSRRYFGEEGTGNEDPFHKSSNMVSEVQDFYAGKSIFITGGTGFLGLCLIEKLLRCVPGLKNIYLLIRPRKQKQIAERLEELIKNSVFDRLRQDDQTHLFKKLIAVAGDIGEESLGLSSVDRLTLVEAVNVVFHSAATLDFEADLKSTTNVNLLGTRRVVQLCQEIRDLEALVYVSSAYANVKLREVNEEVYPAPANVDEVLMLVQQLDSATLIAETPTILNGHENPYTFTKHLAEHEIVNSRLPATIVRPSMIIGAWKEPVPGWTASKNGPQGFLMGASKGVVRRLPVAKNLVYDYIPVDVVVNNLIVAAYSVKRDGNKGVKVYHCTSSTCNPFAWKSMEDRINTYLHKFPLQSAVWYPHVKILPSLLWFKISALFVHMIPAYFLDTITRICGGRPILVRLHTSVNNSLRRLEKFIFTEWKFHNPRTLELSDSLSTEDQNLFYIDIKSLVWPEFFLELTQGVRIYLNKESPKNLDRARRKDKILLVAHLGLQALLLGLVWWIFKTLFALTWTKTGMIVPLSYLIFAQL
ncbi:hypothetical protein KM043_001508 [Ampulex compressa]|nr:hypothetical protein KM043_001508 [Ampulex compressa]